jgi:hypothetical protein
VSKVRAAVSGIPRQTPVDVLLVKIDNPEIKGGNAELGQPKEIKRGADVVLQHVRKNEYAKAVGADFVSLAEILSPV